MDRFRLDAAALRLSLLALGVANTLCGLGLAFHPIKRAELLSDCFLVALICLGEYTMVIEAASLCDERRANTCLFARFNQTFAVVVAVQIAILVIRHVSTELVFELAWLLKIGEGFSRRLFARYSRASRSPIRAYEAGLYSSQLDETICSRFASIVTELAKGS
ncbi:hypothetical protein KC361_g8334 [Hortaea werneckii]|nr:hypothetical protein KC361_g8334 [Hortaea werneckii]